MNIKDLVGLFQQPHGDDDDQVCMEISICDSSQSIEIILDTSSKDYYLDKAPGENEDVGLYRDKATQHVVGVSLPLRQRKIRLNCDGTMQMVQGFVDTPTTDSP